MSKPEEQLTDSPLLSERGVTKISDTVVSSIAGMAAQEVEGVHMGGGTSRAASGVLGSITGSEGKTGGISVEVGTTETAIDLRMGVEYNKNILQTVEEVRRRITDRVEEMTGLRIKELNATITDITFPEKEQRRRLGPARSTGESDSEQATDTAPETQPESEPETQQEEATPVEPTSRAPHTEGSSGPVPEEEVRVEDRPLEEGETAELRTEEQQTDEVPETSEETQEARAETETTHEPIAETEETQETSAEAETTQEARAETETPEEAETRPEPETAETESPEARMRRRAEERARRRRRRNTEDS
jgi:uncharacterized alkaline shock family protein YloU